MSAAFYIRRSSNPGTGLEITAAINLLCSFSSVYFVCAIVEQTLVLIFHSTTGHFWREMSGRQATHQCKVNTIFSSFKLNLLKTSEDTVQKIVCLHSVPVLSEGLCHSQLEERPLRLVWSVISLDGTV